MALFGTPPDGSPIRSQPGQARNSLFEDEPAAKLQSGSLFDDGNDIIGKSPWSSGTPKRGSNLLKTLLPSASVPESYVDIFDNALEATDSNAGTGLSLTAIKSVLADGKVSAQSQSRILDIVVPGGRESINGLGRGEFNVLLALIALAQQGDELSLDNVDDRKRNLPEPTLPSYSRSRTPKPISGTDVLPINDSKSQKGVSNGHSNNAPNASVGSTEGDPWAKSQERDGFKHSQTTSSYRDSQKVSSNKVFGNSSIVSAATDQPAGSETHGPNERPSSGGGSDGWDSYGGGGNRDFNGSRDSGIGGNGFGDDGNNSGSERHNRTIGRGTVTGSQVEETVKIVVLPEKEGMFLFQHRNYEVSSIRRGSKVVRRYSDFVWLLDCLQKRYPFRQLPLLPPKRVAVNGNHLSSDIAFIEKRRRGLTRFTNALIRHPVLNQEQLVIMFLTVPTELAVWRKQATISVQEEFTGKELPPSLEDSLPPTLNETFDTVRSGVRRAAEIYVNLCNLLERLIKRNEGIAADCLRFSLALESLSETTTDSYHIDTNDVPLLNDGLTAAAKHFSSSQSILEDEARGSDDGVLEDMKRQRDVLVAVRDMFDRRDRYARDSIPALERRIDGNETKLATLRSKPEGTVKPGDIEKVENAIINDKQSIVAQHARGVFIKECIRDELNFFQQSQYHVSKLVQDWSQERVKYAELQADNWRSLSDQVESMPAGE